MNFVGAIQPACLANSDWIIANSLRLIRSHRVKLLIRSHRVKLLIRSHRVELLIHSHMEEILIRSHRGKILIRSYIDRLQLIKQRQSADGGVALLCRFEQECLQTQATHGFGKIHIRQF